jgi:hypothetical protein
MLASPGAALVVSTTPRRVREDVVGFNNGLQPRDVDGMRTRGVGMQRAYQSPIRVVDLCARGVRTDFKVGVPVDKSRVRVVSHRRATSTNRVTEPWDEVTGSPVRGARQVSSYAAGQPAVMASRCGSDSTSILRGLAVSATGIVTVSTPFS